MPEGNTGATEMRDLEVEHPKAHLPQEHALGALLAKRSWQVLPLAVDWPSQAQVPNRLKRLQSRCSLTMPHISHRHSPMSVIRIRVAVKRFGQIVRLLWTHGLARRSLRGHKRCLMDAFQKGKRLISTEAVPRADSWLNEDGWTNHHLCENAHAGWARERLLPQELDADHWVTCHYPAGTGTSPGVARVCPA